MITPQKLADHAKNISKSHQLKIKLLNKAACKKQNMNLFLAVGAGSTTNPPVFIHLSYLPKGKPSKRKVFLVGKGVTFDSGGLSLKPGAGMMEMKMDMAGSAAVLSTMESVAKLKPNFEVHAIVAATENMPDGDACRPGDIIVGKDGTSVEILNTDAEGRLTLADAITYSKEQGATEIIDLATLTGACIVALGPDTAGLYSDHSDLSEGLLQAAKNTHESLWQMPLTKAYNKMLKSPVADLKNIGGSGGGSITAALFLQHFSGDTTWAHLDIAGPAYSSSDEGVLTKGGTGYGVQTLIEYICPLES
jgi:leucyl aminopeptidase